MKGWKHIILPGTPLHEMSVAISEPPTCEELRHQLGGWLKVVPAFTTYKGRRCVAFCDEEGKLKNLPLNETATLAWYDCVDTGDALVGPIVVITGDDELLEAFDLIFLTTQSG